MVYNPYILIPAATWLIAQLIKFSINAFGGNISFKQLFASGGMPSGHSAVVASLATTAFLLDGAASHLFGLTVVVAAIVMYDSFGVRRSVGEQGLALNILLDSLAAEKVGPINRPKVREVLGHQPLEVIIGAVLGVILAGLFSYDHIQPLVNFLMDVPGKKELIGYAVAAVIIIVGGVVLRFGLRRPRPKSRVLKQISAKVFTRAQIVGWLCLAIGFASYERAQYLSWRLWSVLILILGIAWLAWSLLEVARVVPSHLAFELDRERKEKWLEPQSKNKSKKKRR